MKKQETVLDIEKKRLIEKKRKLLIEKVRKAEEEYKTGKLKPKSVEDIMKDIDETDTDK